MSVILDALRKSEHQRKQEQTFKTLLPISPQATPPNSSRALVIAYILIAILGLLLVVNLVLQYKPSSIRQLFGSYVNQANVERPISAAIENNEKKTHLAPSLSAQTHQDTVQHSNNTETLGSSATTIKKDSQKTTPHVPPPSPTPRSTKAFTSQKTGQDHAPLITELPHALQQQIPPLTYSSHWFDKASTKSTILINNISLKEGSRINNKLSVKSISAAGTVLDFNGQLFFLPMLQNWSDES